MFTSVALATFENNEVDVDADIVIHPDEAVDNVIGLLGAEQAEQGEGEMEDWGEDELVEEAPDVWEAREPIGPTAILLDVDETCASLKGQKQVGHVENAVRDKGLVKCIRIGDGLISNWVDDIDWQVSQVCQRLHNDPDFADKQINIVGFGQGGLIGRAVV